MKIFNKEINTSIATASVTEVANAIKESTEIIDLLLPITKELQDREKFEDKYGADHEDRLLDLLDEIVEYPIPKALIDFATFAVPIEVQAYRRASDAVSNFNKVKQIAFTNASIALPFEVDEHEEFVNLCRQTLGNTAYMLLIFLDLAEIKKHIINKEDYDIPSCLIQYLKSRGNIDDQVVLAYCDKIIDVARSYRPVMPLFDEYPELEDPFFEAMGSASMDLTDIEDFVTIEDIKAIINGEEPDDIVKRIKKREGLIS